MKTISHKQWNIYIYIQRKTEENKHWNNKGNDEQTQCIFFQKKDKNHEKKHTTIMKTIGKILKIDENSKENNEKKHIVK